MIVEIIGKKSGEFIGQIAGDVIGMMTGGMSNHLWQSTWFAIAAALLALSFRKNRAQVRHCLWLSASLKFLIPFSLLMNLGNSLWYALAARKIATAIAPPAVSLTMAQITQPFPDTFSIASSAPLAPNWIFIAVLTMWACGFAAIALMRFRGWLRIRAAVLNSSPIDIGASVKVRSSVTLLEPGIFGFFRPILLLPEGILQNLTAPQLQTVLAHELAHIRRRDNLTAALHMVVEAVFWFHPLVWWIGARLVEERERACDEAVLSLGNQPRDYAEAILNVCKFYVESPLACVSGVTGASITRRIHAILTQSVANQMTRTKKIALVTAAIAALTLPVALGILIAPQLRAQSAMRPVPNWDVVSVKPCQGRASAVPRGRGGAGGGPPASFSPERMTLNCQPLIRYIQDAYLLFPNSQPPASRGVAMSTPIEGLPDWASSERYLIEANSDTNATPEMMEGPMLQAILEVRFKLKLHHETREVPIYDLVVAKGGPKLTSFVEGSCVPSPRLPDIITVPPTRPPALPAGQRYCSHGGGLTGPVPTNVIIQADDVTMGEFCDGFLVSVGEDDRHVVDKTGLTGKYSIHFEYAPTDASRQQKMVRGISVGDPTAPDIFTAIQEQLGLKLAPGKGSGDFIVINHIEQPSPN